MTFSLRPKRVFRAFDRCFGEDTGGFLEGSGGEKESVASCLGGTKKQVFADGCRCLRHRDAGSSHGMQAIRQSRRGSRNAGSVDLDLTQHLMNDDLDVFIVDLYALAAVNLLDFLTI